MKALRASIQRDMVAITTQAGTDTLRTVSNSILLNPAGNTWTLIHLNQIGT